MVGQIADRKLHNKLFYQLSTFVKAYSLFMENRGYECNDEDINSLKDNILNSFNDGSNVLIGENGYVALGDKYNNLAFQWGVGDGNYEIDITIPIEATILSINICDCYGLPGSDGKVYSPIISVKRAENTSTTNKITVNSAFYNNNSALSSRTNLGFFYYFVICKIQ